MDLFIIAMMINVIIFTFGIISTFLFNNIILSIIAFTSMPLVTYLFMNIDMYKMYKKSK